MKIIKKIIIIVFYLILTASFAWGKLPPPGSGGGDVPANILIMLDTSGSMGWTTKYSFKNPSNSVVDSIGNIYVVDRMDHKVIKFDPTGTFVFSFGGRGHSPGKLYYPWGIAISAQNEIYIADTYNNQIQVFDEMGHFVRAWGGILSGDKQFQTGPYGIAVDNSGLVYVAETFSHKIKIFDKQGKIIREVGGYGNTNGKFFYPFGVAVDNFGNFYVSDTYNHRIQKFNNKGMFLLEWGGVGIGDSQFRYNYSIAVDSEGNIYVSDWQNSRIQKFDLDGNFLGKWGSFGTRNGQFYGVLGLSVANGKIYAPDYYGKRVQVFDKYGRYDKSIGESTAGLDEAKLVIKKIVSDSELIAGANYGLMQWNSFAKMEVPISANGAGKIYQNIKKLEAGGGTNLDNAMKLARSYLLGASSPINQDLKCQKTFLIVISDGIWRDINASKIARKLFEDNGIQTYAVGFRTGGNANYIKLAKAGNTYPTSPLYASNYEQLYLTLSKAIRKIINSLFTSNSPIIVPGTESKNYLYQSVFSFKKDKQWEGHLNKYLLGETGEIKKKLWDAGEKLFKKPELERNIMTLGYGLAFETNNFHLKNIKKLKNLMYLDTGKKADDQEVENLINFIRGLDSFDENKNGIKGEERWKLGDIYHSQTLFVGPPSEISVADESNIYSMANYRKENGYIEFIESNNCGGPCKNRKAVVFAGSNDGMLHVFDAESGEELWAFIPPAILTKLSEMLSDKANSSQSIYGVDGSPVVKDILINKEWKTVLICGLGRGGNSYFVLDITDVENPKHLFSFENNTLDKSINIWKLNQLAEQYFYDSSNEVPEQYDFKNNPGVAINNVDQTLYKDVDDIPNQKNFSRLGESWSTPNILNIRINNKPRWVAVFGGGYNGKVSSEVGNNVFVIDLENSGDILKAIPLYDKPGNGIQAAVPVKLAAINADTTNKAKYFGSIIYFSDLEGKLWKINLTDKDNLYKSQILFDSEATSGNQRYSFNPLTISVDLDNKIILYFGTGDITKLELKDSITKNKVFAVKDLEFTNFNQSSLPLKEDNLKQIIDEKICDETENGWFYNLEPNRKITGKAAIKKNLIYFSSYRPNFDDLCMAGSGSLFEFSYSCGKLLNTVELKEGAPTGATLFQNKIYIGISGTPNNKVINLSDGFIRTNNLVIGTISNLNNDSMGTILVESWKQLN
jgi:sugar lactone lactonase YvrE